MNGTPCAKSGHEFSHKNAISETFPDTAVLTVETAFMLSAEIVAVAITFPEPFFPSALYCADFVVLGALIPKISVFVTTSFTNASQLHVHA